MSDTSIPLIQPPSVDSTVHDPRFWSLEGRPAGPGVCIVAYEQDADGSTHSEIVCDDPPLEFAKEVVVLHNAYLGDEGWTYFTRMWRPDEEQEA